MGLRDKKLDEISKSILKNFKETDGLLSHIDSVLG